MRIVLVIAGVILLFAGAIWLLQGIGLLPGSFMSGQTQWAVYGALAIILGAGLVAVGIRRRRGSG